jgi:cell division protein FtsL
MARNRKNQSAAIRFGPALKACLVCLLIVICCVGYVWQKRQIYELAQQIKKREVRLVELHEQNDKLKKQMAVLLSPQSLDQRVQELRLGLAPPRPEMVWRLPEPPSGLMSAGMEQQYAAERRMP